VQDLQYVAASSGRQGLSTRPAAAPLAAAPAPPAPPAPAPAPSNATTVKLWPVSDSYVNAAAPNANYGTSSALASRGTSGYVSYLRFALPNPPPGKRLTGAALRVYTRGVSYAGSNDVHYVHLNPSTWSSRTVTWNTRPALQPSVLGKFTGATELNNFHYATLNVAPLQTLQGANRTFAIRSSGTDNLWLWSGNSSVTWKRPRLILTYR
ncbi:MAG: DNRLRE domain-containing protein, partial [Chloroflexota bacterium]|nr:DNRLRE domain-containing protein [Chloroflexota bacterium]